MTGGKGRFAGIVLGCCLGVAAGGCACHRTGHGFVVGSRWSLEYSTQAPRFSFRSAKGADGGRTESDQSPAVANKPELLPWRSRLKGYRLGARIFHGGESSDSANPPGMAIASSSKTPPLALPPVADTVSSDGSSRPDVAVD